MDVIISILWFRTTRKNNATTKEPDFAVTATAICCTGRVEERHVLVWNLSVSQLCDVIKQHRSLRRAEILSTECYTEYTGRVVHRFLLLELHREGRKDIWPRLDRRPG